MSSYNISNTKLSNNLTSTFTNAGNVKRSFTRNRSSGQNNNQDIGSKIIENNDTNKVKSQNPIAVNNSRPILNKTEYGNLVIINNAKLIRSKLSTVVNYLCPSNDASTVYYLGGTFETSQTKLTESNFCYQFVPPPATDLPEIPITVNGDEITQNGIYLRYREKNDIYNDWNTIFVPQSSVVPVTGVADDGTSYIFNSINFSDILPNGNYIIEYELLESE